jgi:hypothetical protein
MPLIGGEKYACQSCIKGHRVSGCNHTDRELHHINPKGRPVKQCEHCRVARKSKSHHAKCDCGDKKDKSKNKDDAKGHCGCHTGGKCMCGGKKDSPGLRLDTSRQTLHDMRARPKVTATHSEVSMTVFANGHHKPCHRNNNSAHLSGAPYQLSRPQSLHGNPTFTPAPQSNTYNSTEMSRDTQSLLNTDFHNVFGSTQQLNDLLPPTPLTANIEAGGFLDSSFQDCFDNFQDNYQDPLFTGQSSTFGHGGNSPTESHFSEALAAPFACLVNANLPYESLATSPNASQEFLPPLESEWAIPSAGLGNPIWCAGDLPLDPNRLSGSPEEPVSHSGESKQSAPGLTASSSPSEMGDVLLYNDLDMAAPVSSGPEPIFWEDTPMYPVSTPAASEIQPPTLAPPRSMPEPQPLQISFAKPMSPLLSSVGSRASSIYSETQAIAMPNSVNEAPPTASWMHQPRTVYPSSIYATFNRPSTFSRFR